MAENLVYDWHTSSLRMAAALAAVRFPIRILVSQDLTTGKVQTLFEVPGVSMDGKWQRDGMIHGLNSGALERSEPMHPLLQGLRALRNYELLVEAQRSGQHLRLVGVAGSQASEYRVGQEVPEMLNAKALFQTADLALVAAMGSLGIPVIRIEDGGGGRRLYTLPALGHALSFRGQVVRHEAVALSRRTAPGQWDLLLEQTDPEHPMVAAYNAVSCRAQLKKALGETGRVIVHRHPKAPLKRMAVTSEDPAPHVKEKLRKHML